MAELEHRVKSFWRLARELTKGKNKRENPEQEEKLHREALATD